MWGNWNNFFNDDFESFQYPSLFDSRLATNQLKKKRNAQDKVLHYKKQLDHAINNGDIYQAQTAAKDLTTAKNNLLKLSKSPSSIEIANDVDQMINEYTKEQLLQPQKSKKKQSKKNQKQEKKKKSQEEEEEEQVVSNKVIIDNEENDERESENSKQNINNKIIENESPTIKIFGDDNDEEQSQSQPVAAGEDEETKQQLQEELDHNINDDDVSMKDMNININNNNKQMNNNAIDEINKICSSTKDAVKKSDEFHQRSLQLVEQLKQFKKDFYDIDATIMDAVLKLDNINVDNNREAQEMRKKIVAYYMSILKKLDCDVEPLNQFFDSKLKTRI